MKDEKGNLYLIEAIFAITILLMAIFIVNTVISIPSPDYSYEGHDLKSAQDIMEILSKKINKVPFFDNLGQKAQVIVLYKILNHYIHMLYKNF